MEIKFILKNNQKQKTRNQTNSFTQKQLIIEDLKIKKIKLQSFFKEISLSNVILYKICKYEI